MRRIAVRSGRLESMWPKTLENVLSVYTHKLEGQSIKVEKIWEAETEIQALAGEMATARIVDAVQGLGGDGFAIEIDRVRSGELHAIRQLEGFDTSSEFAVGRASFKLAMSVWTAR